MARTAKKKIQILDEGIEITPDVDSIDLTGLGITGTNTGGNNVQQAVPLGAVGTNKITVATVAPSTPAVNDLWVDIS